MSGATYLCVIGCVSECRHGVPCVIGSMGAREGDHQTVRGRRKHGGDDGRWHEWVGDAGTGRCVVRTYEEMDAELDADPQPINLTLAWRPGDPCKACGSTDTAWGLPHEGAICNACGAQDDDD